MENNYILQESNGGDFRAIQEVKNNGVISHYNFLYRLGKNGNMKVIVCFTYEEAIELYKNFNKDVALS